MIHLRCGRKLFSTYLRLLTRRRQQCGEAWNAPWPHGALTWFTRADNSCQHPMINDVSSAKCIVLLSAACLLSFSLSSRTSSSLPLTNRCDYPNCEGKLTCWWRVYSLLWRLFVSCNIKHQGSLYLSSIRITGKRRKVKSFSCLQCMFLLIYFMAQQPLESFDRPLMKIFLSDSILVTVICYPTLSVFMFPTLFINLCYLLY